MAGDHFAITPLGGFQLRLAASLQLFNQSEVAAVAETFSVTPPVNCLN